MSQRDKELPKGATFELALTGRIGVSAASKRTPSKRNSLSKAVRRRKLCVFKGRHMPLCSGKEVRKSGGWTSLRPTGLGAELFICLWTVFVLLSEM